MRNRTTVSLTFCFVTCSFLTACRPHAAHLADPRSADEKAWDAAHDAENAEQLGDAAADYRSLCEKAVPYVRACFDYARLLYRIAPVASARATSVQTILRYPDEALTQSLIKRLARSYRNADASAEGMTALIRLENQMKNSETRDTVLFEIARLARDDGDVEQETAALSTLAETHGRWSSQLWDDAVWRLSEICRDTHQTAAETAWLNKLSAEQKTSRLIGSYTSPYHDDALFRLGEIHLNAGRIEAARMAFSALAALSTSRMSDEGLLGLAKVDLAAGRVRAACEKLLQLQNRDGPAKPAAAELSVLNNCEN